MSITRLTSIDIQNIAGGCECYCGVRGKPGCFDFGNVADDVHCENSCIANDYRYCYCQGKKNP